MSILVAIDISSDTIQLVTGETTSSGSISILNVKELARSEFLPRSLSQSQSGAISQNGVGNGEGAQGTNGSHSDGAGTIEAGTASPTPEVSSPEIPVRKLDLGQLLDLDIDETLAVLPSARILYEKVSLPFRDQKKIERVLPLQIQDLVPFETEGFVVDAVSLKEISETEFDYLASLAPTEDVQEALQMLSQLGANPKTLTSKSSALTALTRLCPEYLKGSFALLLFSPSQCSFAVFVDSQLEHLRELPLQNEDPNSAQLKNVILDLRCSIAHVERTFGKQIERVFTVGSPQLGQSIQKVLGRSCEPLDVSSFVSIDPFVTASANDLALAVGLFASELPVTTGTRVINYRQGRFAYKPTWGNFVLAFKDEWYNYFFLLLAFVGWCGYTVASGYNALNQIEGQITKEIQKVLPGEVIPYQQEGDFVKNKVSDLEEQLESLGSLSSLTPLNSLRELSEAIGKEIDIEIDSLNIGHKSLSMRGSVLTNRMVGALQDALEKRSDRLGKVNVAPGGSVPGSTRVKFNADITFPD